ncbi:GroES-like protein [Plenodomus tracheiphilus IPT5]|uniref:GroES-like protein n=1 Tax=Plenodomus tracheiphilus IPT5 TaxID=1408161 RepID=A0A6A7APX9_9PLEO|nr:GroES-like protein [Plenodomus tracheiphilus IPT5]
MKALVTSNTLYSRIGNLVLGGKNLTSVRSQWKDVPKPTIADNEILVKVRAVALNPTDAKHIDLIGPSGCIVGCDYAGTVDQVGKNATHLWNIGDRVAGAVHGGLFPDRGAFAEYLKIDGDLAWKVPENVDDATATTYGVSAGTALLALCGRLGLPHPDTLLDGSSNAAKESQVILIYAGSTAAGLFTIQMAKALGCKVVTTASPHSFSLVKSYGADAVFDYHDKDVAAEIAKNYPDIKMAVDCISEGPSFKICDTAIGKKGGQVIVLLPGAKPSISTVKHELILAYTLFGRPFKWLQPVGPKYAAIPTDRAMFAKFYAVLPKLLDVLKPLPITREAGGMDAIQPGLDKLREKKVSGSKLVIEF